MVFKKNRFLWVSLFITLLHLTGSSSLLAAGLKLGTKFKLFPSNYFTEYKTETKLSGSGPRGMALEGGINEETLAKTTFMGEPAIPIQTVTVFTTKGMSFGLATVIHYYSVQADKRRYLGTGGEITTVKATPELIPISATVGSSGKIGTYIDKRNFKTVLTWELKDGPNGKAKLIILNKTTKPSGELDNKFTTTYLIRQNGDRESIDMETYNDTVKATMTFEGKYK